ncbi:Carboxylic ester hydrolase [Pleurostoma richardsiae]|uniref:Carboxylic ester hydrolase n=1 Tax=Pleurostoma richardsiae TaxID=41990 RepID=A0AA38RN91_9PEZI|nr:Carboxylic ester hydrolase [Pleurostoma richardsiae]
MALQFSFVLGALAVVVSVGSSSNTDAFQTRCSSLLNYTTIPNANSSSSEFVEAGTTIQFPGADSSCGRPSQVVSVSLCRITAHVATSSRSGIKLELWLPENWSCRFLSTGNGGLGGCVQYEDIEYAASLGFAAVGTNNGHDGMSGQSFLNNPDVIEDFAYRALHAGVVLGKAIAHTFYGMPHSKSYYLGCSTGGRQGLKEAQAFPDDFDGIVAGAPANSFNNLTSWSCHFLPLTGPTQVDTLRSIYSPLLSIDGSLVYPHLQPGAELTGAPQTYFTGQPFGAADWFRYAIFNDFAWDPFSLTPEDYVISSNLNLFNIETWDGHLSAFKSRGGKLLQYHGLADGTISSENSPRYYEHVSQTMGFAPRDLDEFYRLFRISGMGHCGGGPAANEVVWQAWIQTRTC